MLTGVTIGLVILLVVPLVAFALVFATGAACGVAAYHLSRIVAVEYQPTRKAIDHEKKRNDAVAVARKLAQETADLQKSYIGGLQLTREQYLAGENGK